MYPVHEMVVGDYIEIEPHQRMAVLASVNYRKAKGQIPLDARFTSRTIPMSDGSKVVRVWRAE